MQIVIRANHFMLLPQRAIYWKEQDALILSDLHLGKAMHFRKSGIPIPLELMNQALTSLSLLIEKFTPEKLIIVGDMFHSVHNNEVSIFDIWRSQFDKPAIFLIKGNHDVLPIRQYHEMNIRIYETLKVEGFAFSHECKPETSQFCFSGHIHPGVRMEGAGKQTIRLPCFHFTPSSCTLPAFGKFTGLAIVKAKPRDKIFVILEKEVVRLLP